jgi:hypothetical protein
MGFSIFVSGVVFGLRPKGLQIVNPRGVWAEVGTYSPYTYWKSGSPEAYGLGRPSSVWHFGAQKFLIVETQSGGPVGSGSSGALSSSVFFMCSIDRSQLRA